MPKPLKATCNQGCGKTFKVKFQAWKIRDDIEQIGFKCPHCHMFYLVSYTNDRIKQLQAEQRDLLKRSDPRTRKYQSLGGIMSAIERKKKQIAAEMEKLRIEVEH